MQTNKKNHRSSHWQPPHLQNLSGWRCLGVSICRSNWGGGQVDKLDRIKNDRGSSHCCGTSKREKCLGSSHNRRNASCWWSSCYASFPHAVSDLALAPVKMFPRMLLDDQESLMVDGKREVVKLMKKMGTAIGLQKRNREEKEDPKSILVDVCQERHSLLLLLLTPQSILSSKAKVLVIFNIGTKWTVSRNGSW